MAASCRAAVVIVDMASLRRLDSPHTRREEQLMEIYSPAYLFKVDADGHPIPRPTISSNPGAISYGASFEIPTADPTNISSVVLVRPGTPTHAFDMMLPPRRVASRRLSRRRTNGKDLAEGRWANSRVRSITSQSNRPLAFARTRCS